MMPIPVYLLAREFKGKTWGLAAAAVVLTSPILFTYAFEARTYALLAFLSAVSTLAFWKSLKREKWQWWGVYFGTAVIGVYTHYYMWFILAAHGIYWLVWERKNWVKVIGIFGGILLAQLPWLPTLVSQLASVAKSYWIAPIDKRTHLEWFVRVTGGDVTAPQQVIMAGAIFGLLIVSLFTVRWKEKRYPKAYLFLWTWLVVPVAIPSLLSLYRPIFFYRYLIFSSIPILMISLWGLTALGRKVLIGGVTLVALGYMSLNIIIWQQYPYSMREEIQKDLAQSQGQKVKMVTVLPAFAEVMYYAQNRAVVQVSIRKATG